MPAQLNVRTSENFLKDALSARASVFVIPALMMMMMTVLHRYSLEKTGML